MSIVKLLVIQKDRMWSRTSPPQNFNLGSYAHKIHRVLRQHGLKVHGVIIDSIDTAPYSLNSVEGFRLMTPRIPPQLFKQIREDLDRLTCHEVKAKPYLPGETVDLTF